VFSDLASLRGPSRGTIELPLRLYWSRPSLVFDLEDPGMRRWLYQIVLREASRRLSTSGILRSRHRPRRPYRRYQQSPVGPYSNAVSVN
jgi:hypothetical protein